MSPAESGPHVSLERMNRFQEPEARRIIGELGLPAGSRGLDVGCGVGLYALWLAEAVGQGGRVVAIEPEAEQGGHGARPRGRRGRRGPARVPAWGRHRHSDARRGAGLGVVRRRAAPHRGHEKALREFARVVRPGGRSSSRSRRSSRDVPARPPGARAAHPARRDRRTLDEGAGQSFQERRQTTPASLRAAGLASVAMRTYTL